MYKYFSFSEYALANILNDELYMNHFESFNDPFECWAEVITGFPNLSDNSERLQIILNAWGFDTSINEDVIENYDLYSESLIDMQPDVQEVLDGARITCFSKRCDNLLMWSHYANGLRGFCLEFDPELLLVNDPNYSKFYEVEYQNTPEVIDTALIAVLQDQINYHADAIDSGVTEDEASSYNDVLNESLAKSNEIFKKMLATKPINWKYEEEVRVIYQSLSDNKTGEFLKYPPQAIKSVIFGEKMPSKQISALKCLFESHLYPIEFKTAKRAKGTFKVIVE
jgi:hypothetical protein